MVDATMRISQEKVGELSSVDLNAPQEERLEGLLAPRIQRMVDQCCALLRQQLERKVKQQPALYSEARVLPIIRELKEARADIQAAVAERVKRRLLEPIQQELRGVFEDALSHIEESLGEQLNSGTDGRLWVKGIAATLFADGEDASRLSEEKKSALGGNGARPDGDTVVGQSLEMRQMVQAEGSSKLEPVASQVRGDSASRGAEVSEDEVSEGTVRVKVEANPGTGEVLKFLNGLYRKSQLRVLQLVGNHGEEVDIWLRLREPLCLKKVLLEMEGVSQVDASPDAEREGSEPVLTVRLVGDISSKQAHSTPSMQSSDKVGVPA